MGHEVHVESSRPLIPVLDPTSGAQYHHHPQQLDSSSAHKLPQATGPGLPSILQAQMPIAHQAACIFLSLPLPPKHQATVDNPYHIESINRVRVICGLPLRVVEASSRRLARVRDQHYQAYNLPRKQWHLQMERSF
ncbi:hypothetical protein EV2_016319 [Malus domestica]